MFLKFFRVVGIVLFMQVNVSVFSTQSVHMAQLPEELKIVISSYMNPLTYVTQYFWQCCMLQKSDVQPIVDWMLQKICKQASGKLLKKHTEKRMNFEKRLSYFFTAPVKIFKGLDVSSVTVAQNNRDLFFLLLQVVKTIFHPTIKNIVFKNCADVVCNYYVVCAYKRECLFQFSVSLQCMVSSDMVTQLKRLRGEGPSVLNQISTVICQQATLNLEMQRAGAFACNLL